MNGFLRLRGSYDDSHKNCATREMASAGLHDELFSIISDRIPSPFNLLDLGSGTGAWGLRVKNAGNNVIGVNLDPSGSPIDCVEADLNKNFSSNFRNQFDVISCIEVLEHVEHPRNVFREAEALLKKDGIFIISTPNASGLYSRVKFLMTGRFAMFDGVQYDRIGHITPLTHWQLEKMFKEIGLEITLTTSFDTTSPFPKTIGDIIKRVAWIFRPFMTGFVGTQHLIMIGKKIQ